MADFAANDFEVIANRVAHEQGFLAGVAGAARSSPVDCKVPIWWFSGYDEGKMAREAAA